MFANINSNSNFLCSLQGSICFNRNEARSFFGWIKDLSAPDPTSIFNLFGLIPWDPPYIFNNWYLATFNGFNNVFATKNKSSTT